MFVSQGLQVLLVSAMAAQCMLWQTSPAATELETKVVDWLRRVQDYRRDAGRVHAALRQEPPGPVDMHQKAW